MSTVQLILLSATIFAQQLLRGSSTIGTRSTAPLLRHNIYIVNDVCVRAPGVDRRVSPTQGAIDLALLDPSTTTKDPACPSPCESLSSTWNRCGLLNLYNTTYRDVDHVRSCGRGVDREDVPVRWVEEPTLLLTAKVGNAADQLFDALLSLFTTLAHLPRYTQAWYVPHLGGVAPNQRPCTEWICGALRFLPHHADIQLWQPNASNAALACFREVHIPRFGRWRPGKGRDEGARFSFATRQNAFHALGLPADSGVAYAQRLRRLALLLIPSAGKEATRRGEGYWLDAADTQTALAPLARSVIVADDASLNAAPFLTTCSIFADADVIVVAHGTHVANLLCARSGAVVIEVACTHRSHATELRWGNTRRALHYGLPASLTLQRTLGLHYAFVEVPQSQCVPPRGEAIGLSASFGLPADAVLRTLRDRFGVDSVQEVQQAPQK